MRKDVKNLTLRIPKQTHSWVVEEAKRNHRTINAQLLFWIQEKMGSAEKKKPQSGNSEVSNSIHKSIGNKL